VTTTVTENKNRYVYILTFQAETIMTTALRH